MNNRRKLKPQVKVLLIVLGVFLGLVILENLIGGISSFVKNTKTQIEYNKKEEAQQQTQKHKTGEKLTDFVNEIIVYLSEEKYDLVYNKTDPDYIEALNIDSVEKMKAIIVEHFNGIPKNAEVVNYSKIDGRYVCEVSIEKEDSIERVELIVTPNGAGNYYIIIDDVRSIEKYNKKYKFINSEFEFDVKYIVQKADEEILVAEAKNKTSKNLIGSVAATSLEKTNHVECMPNNVEELQQIEFPSNTPVKFLLTFQNDKYAAYPDESLNLKVQFDNGTKIDRTINMVPVEDY